MTSASAPALPERARRLTHLLLVEREHDLAVGVDALGHLEAQLPRDERLEGALQAVRGRAGAAPELQHVAEAARGDQPGPGALALEQRVGRRRRAVDERLDLAGRDASFGERREHALRLVPRRGRHLGGPDGAGRLVEQHEVGEGAADVDADDDGRVPQRSRLSARITARDD